MKKRFLKLLQTLPHTNCVALYADFKKEVETSEIFEALKRGGKEVVYPRMSSPRGKKKILEFFKVDDLGDLKKASYAILEPHPLNKKISHGQIDVIVVPGVAFDDYGYRLGYGKGYYDRLLKKMDAKKIGLAFDFQRIKRMPRDRWDQPVDILVTEKRVWEFR